MAKGVIAILSRGDVVVWIIQRSRVMAVLFAWKRESNEMYINLSSGSNRVQAEPSQIGIVSGVLGPRMMRTHDRPTRWWSWAFE